MDERERKEMRERRREYAAARNCNNEEIAVANGMAEEAAELISRVCRLRHNIHCDIDHYVLGEDGGGDCEILADTFDELRRYDIPQPTFNYRNFFDDTDTMFLLTDPYYGDDEPDRDEDEKAWQKWYDTHYERIYDEYEEMNTKIERWLATIDKKYGTTFCPTGATRIW